MSIRDRASSQQVLAVALALVMLVSMGGMAFAGGVGAQTGGTYDQVFDESDDIGSDLNVGEDQVLAVSPDADPAGDEVAVQSNGDVALTGTSDAGEFVGVSLTNDRIADLSGVQADPASEPATFLDEAPAQFDTNSADTTSAVFIEFDPQSNFSQIEGIEGVDGSHDFIVVAPEGAQVNGLVDTDATDTNGDISDGDVVALSVDNNGAAAGGASSSLLASGGDYGAVFDQLVGSSDSDLQNENIADFQYAAGTFENTNPTLDQVQLGDDVSTFETGQTVHSEKITLVDADDESERYFNSIANAEGAAGTGDTIRLDDGSYDDGVDLTVDGLTVQADATDDDPTVPGTVEYSAANVTVDGLDINNGVTDDGVGVESPTLTNAIVDEDGLGTGVNFGASTDATVTDTTIIDASDSGVSDGQTGLDVSNGYETVTGNDIQDFQTQILATTDEDMTALLADNAFEGNDDAQAAVSVNDTDAVQGDTIFGSVDDADTAADPGETVEVYGGSYEHGGPIDIATEGVSLVDVEDAATISDEVDLNAAGDVSVDGFDLDGNNLDTDGSPSALTITDTNAADFNLGGVADVTLIGTTGQVYTIDGTNADITGATGYTFSVTATDDVSVDSVTTTLAGDDGIVITSSAAGDISVEDSVVNMDDAQTGVDITSADDNSEESVTVSNVTVTSDGVDPTGVSINTIDTDTATNAYVINDSDLSVANGVGIDVDEVSGDNDGSIVIDNNDIAGDNELIGIAYNLPDTEAVDITNNEIIGTTTDGGAASVGIEFEEVSAFGSGLFDGTGTTMTFEENTISGHARVIEDDGGGADTVTEEDYTAIVNDLNNEFGTLVIGPDGDYEATYGAIENFEVDGDASASYLPGSVSQANALVHDNLANAPGNNNDPLETTTLEVRDPADVTVGDAPDSYVESGNGDGGTSDDNIVALPDMESVTVTGENPSVTVEGAFELANGDAENNHDITDLTIESGANTAITVASDSSQSTFEDLTVTSTADGLVVEADGADVNVIEVADSSFDVDTNGIVLSSGTNTAPNADDRDGYILDNVSVTGDGLQDGTGLDLSQVDKPGKDGLGVNLTIQNSDVSDFRTQVSLSDDLDLTATQVVEETVDIDGVTIQNNEAEQAVLVLNSDGTDAGEDLFGSINAADAAATGGANEIIDIRNTFDDGSPAYYEHGGAVTINTDDVTVSGPVSMDGSQDVRDSEVVIQDNIVVNTDTAGDPVTLEGFAVVTEQSSGILAGSGGTSQAVIASQTTDLTVANLSITTTLDPDETEEMPIGIGAVDTGLTIEDTYVGAHNAPGAQTTGTAVVAENTATLTITDSVFNAGEDGDADAGTPSNAFGVIAGVDTTPELTRTTITDFDQAGLQVAAESLTITDGDISNNGNVGDVSDAGVVSADSVDAAATQYKIDGTTIEDNAGDGVSLTDVGLNLIDATVSDNDDGVVVTSDDSTVANVSVTSSTVSDHDGEDTTGVDITSSNATVSDNSITANTNGLTLSLDDTEAPVVTFNNIANNDNGLTVTEGAALMTLTGNDFANSVDIDNQDGDHELDATLNYFGELGPDATDGIADGSETVVYDPFLTESVRNDVSTAADVEQTTSFGHDVVIPEDGIVSVGFPAEPEADTVGDVINGDVAGTVYMWDQSEQKFTNVGTDASIGAFDVLVVENRGDKPTTAAITYKDDSARNDPVDNTFTFKEGFNFVPAQQTGTVDEALFAGDGSDYVAQPFSSGENLYGDRDADQVRDQFTTPSADGFGANFASGVGDEVVHPHAGYFVIVNEESNIGNTRSEQIPSAGVPTAENIDERTGSTPATFQLSSPSVTANATNESVDVVVDVENIGDVDGAADITATALTGFDDAPVSASTSNVNVAANDDGTVQLTITGTGLEAGDQVRVEIEVDGTDESVKVTAEA